MQLVGRGEKNIKAEAGGLGMSSTARVSLSSPHPPPQTSTSAGSTTAAATTSAGTRWAASSAAARRATSCSSTRGTAKVRAARGHGCHLSLPPVPTSPVASPGSASSSAPSQVLLGHLGATGIGNPPPQSHGQHSASAAASPESRGLGAMGWGGADAPGLRPLSSPSRFYALTSLMRAWQLT